eukprot:scaffold24550_cov60-Cyclotella_meneghiniana.AAC.17
MGILELYPCLPCQTGRSLSLVATPTSSIRRTAGNMLRNIIQELECTSSADSNSRCHPEIAQTISQVLDLTPPSFIPRIRDESSSFRWMVYEMARR